MDKEKTADKFPKILGNAEISEILFSHIIPLVRKKKLFLEYSKNHSKS